MKIYFKPSRIVSSLFIIITFSFLSGCATHSTSLDRAEKNYYAHDYARAFKELWGPVSSHDPRATYAMGYMYYYGLGTDKDQDIGRSLIRRSAAWHYPPAIQALKIITQTRHEQYLPFEKYSSTGPARLRRYSSVTPVHDEGILEINKPLFRRKNV